MLNVYGAKSSVGFLSVSDFLCVDRFETLVSSNLVLQFDCCFGNHCIDGGSR